MINKENSKRNEKLKVLLVSPYRNGGYEPRGLLSINNYIKEVCDPGILDINIMKFGPIGAVRYIIQNGINVVGLSLLFEESNDWASVFVKLLKKYRKNVILVLGGFGPTFSTEFFVEKYQPDFIVVGPGEQAMKALIENNFEIDSNPNKNGGLLITTQSNTGTDFGTTVVTNTQLPDINNLDFSRPEYFFTKYRNVSVDCTRGCVGKCIFCNPIAFTGNRQVVSRNIEISKREIDYILKNTHPKLYIKLSSSGNSFNNPNDTIELMRYLEEKGVEGRRFLITLRLDMIDFIIKNSVIMRRFLYLNNVVFEIGLETLDTEILLELKKIGKNNKDCDYFDKINKLASAFPEVTIF